MSKLKNIVDITLIIVTTIVVVAIVFIAFTTNIMGKRASDLNDDIEIVKESKVSQLYIDGENLFVKDCRVCHVSKEMKHNYLEGVIEKVGLNYLKLYLTKQDSLITVEDKYAIAIKKEYNNMPNSHNFKYSEEELNAIIEYLK